MSMNENDRYWLRKGMNAEEVAALLDAVGERVLDRRCRDRCIHFMDAGNTPLLCPHYRFDKGRPLSCKGYERDLFGEYAALTIERMDILAAYKAGRITDEEFVARATPVRERMGEIAPLLG